MNASKDHIIQLILGHQARVLTERAQKAIRQIRDDQLVDDVQSIDASTLQPPSTAYSSSGTRSDRSMSDSLSNSTADHQDTSTTIRSRVQKQIKLRKVCVCVCIILPSFQPSFLLSPYLPPFIFFPLFFPLSFPPSEYRGVEHKWHSNY